MMFVSADQAGLMLTAEFTWTLLAAPDDEQFICSDTPLAIYDEEPEFEGSGLGYGSGSAETTLALDPGHCLLIRHGKKLWTRRAATAELVDEINLRTYAWAQGRIYGPTEELLRDVHKRAQKEPERVRAREPRPGKLWAVEEVDGEMVATEVWPGSG